MSVLREAIYGVGAFGYTILSFSVISWSMYYYVPPPFQGLVPRVPVYLFGVAMVMGRVIGALSDPIIGYWSDHVSTRWGKRLPFVIFGTLPLGVLYILLWNPPLQNESILNFAFLALVLMSFFFMYTFVVCPYLALLPAIARNPVERVRLSTWLSVGIMAGGALVGVSSSFLIGLVGFKLMGVLWSVVAMACLYVSAWVLRDADRGSPVKGLASLNGFSSRSPFSGFSIARIRGVFLEVGKDESLLVYLRTMTLAWMGINVLLISLPYLLSVYLGIDKEDIGMYAGATVFTTALVLPWLGFVVARLGQKNAFGLAMLSAAVLTTSFLLAGHNPLPLSNSAQALIFFALAGLPLAPLYVLPNSLMAEIIDHRKRRTGDDVEAFYFGLQGLVLEFSLGLSFGVTSLFLGCLGYGGEKSLGIAIIPVVTGLCFAGAYAFFRKFPIGGGKGGFPKTRHLSC